jgi:hypothetical protein
VSDQPKFIAYGTDYEFFLREMRGELLLAAARAKREKRVWLNDYMLEQCEQITKYIKQREDEKSL